MSGARQCGPQAVTVTDSHEVRAHASTASAPQQAAESGDALRRERSQQKNLHSCDEGLQRPQLVFGEFGSVFTEAIVTNVSRFAQPEDARYAAHGPNGLASIPSFDVVRSESLLPPTSLGSDELGVDISGYATVLSHARWRWQRDFVIREWSRDSEFDLQRSTFAVVCQRLK